MKCYSFCSPPPMPPQRKRDIGSSADRSVPAVPGVPTAILHLKPIVLVPARRAILDKSCDLVTPLGSMGFRMSVPLPVQPSESGSGMSALEKRRRSIERQLWQQSCCRTAPANDCFWGRPRTLSCESQDFRISRKGMTVMEVH